MDESSINLSSATGSGIQRSVLPATPKARWIHRNQLQIGMVVNHLDRPWDNTNTLHRGFRIESQESLLFVQDACEYVSVMDQ